MQTYIVFLKGINVSGKNIIKMADLKVVLTNAAFTEVQTYIQSGNIVVQTTRTCEETSIQIHELIKEHFQLNIAVFVVTPEQLNAAFKNNPYPEDAPGNKVFITFLDQDIEQNAVVLLKKEVIGSESFEIIHNILYYYLPEGMSNSKLSNPFFEKKLKVVATGRNLNTVRKMLSLVTSA